MLQHTNHFFLVFFSHPLLRSQQCMNGITVDFNRYENGVWCMWSIFKLNVHKNALSCVDNTQERLYSTTFDREKKIIKGKKNKTENAKDKRLARHGRCFYVERLGGCWRLRLSRSVWYKLEESGQEPVAATSTWSSESPAFTAQQQAPLRTIGDSSYHNICRGVRKCYSGGHL